MDKMREPLHTPLLPSPLLLSRDDDLRLSLVHSSNSVIERMAQDMPKAETKDATAGAGDRKVKMPTYPKMNRQHISERTLQHFQLPYKEDPHDSSYLIIFREMEVYETDLLFEHTKRLRAGTLFPNGSQERRHSAPVISVDSPKGTRDSTPSTPVQSPAGRRTVSSEQKGGPDTTFQRRWSRNLNVSDNVPPRADSLSPEPNPIKLSPRPSTPTSRPATPKSATPKPPVSPRYSDLRVYRKHVSEESLRYFEIPYKWNPDEPDCLTLLCEMGDAQMESLFRHTKKLKEPSTPKKTVVHEDARAQLTTLRQTLEDTVWPHCEEFKASPPEDEEERKEEYDLLSELLVTKMLSKVNQIETDGDDGAKTAKVELVMECHRVMRTLSEAMKQE